MKKSIIMGLLLTSLLITSVTASAVSKKIKSSGHYLVSNTSNNNICAEGYTESDSYHYTSVQLIETSPIIHTTRTTTSDRKWGTGTVYQRTSDWESKEKYSYSSAVFYGF